MPDLEFKGMSPVLPVALWLSQQRGIGIFQAGDLLEPYTVVPNEGLARFRPEADLPPWVLEAIAGALPDVHPKWLSSEQTDA